MQKVFLLLPLLFAAGCGCQEITCPSGQLDAYQSYMPTAEPEFTNDTLVLTIAGSYEKSVTPPSVGATKKKAL